MFEQLKARMASLYGEESSVFGLFSFFCSRIDDTPWNFMMLDSLVSEHEAGFRALAESEAI